jgi:thiol:disulfide interchange protein
LKRNIIFFFTFIVSYLTFSQNPVTFETTVKKVSDSNFQLITNATIEEGWRLYSQNLLDGGAIPTEFVYEENNSYILLGPTIESESITKFDPIFSLDQTYFESFSTFYQDIQIEKNISYLNAKIYFQACDDIVCIFREADLIFNFDGSKSEIKNNDLTSLVVNNDNPLFVEFTGKELLSSENNSANSFSSNSYLNLLILGFIGGILALLTPCVFPMIPLTVSFFTNKNSNKNSKLNAFTYGFFIVAIYLIISIPFHFLDSIDPEILNSVSTNAYLNILFFVIFILFAFSFFGFYEITLPSSWINSIDSKSNSIGGYVGIFFMALTLVLVSFSCTGPILGSLLVGSISSQGGALQLTIGMLGFGIALALPFTIFALFPNLLNKLPKYVVWMNTFKVKL